jgi:hypothetical protein
MLKRDDLKFGIILGFLAPIIGMITYYFISFYTRDVRFTEFLMYMKTNKALLTGVSSISLVANAVIFTIFINTHKDRTARGIFVATLVYGIIVLLIKLVG